MEAVPLQLLRPGVLINADAYCRCWDALPDGLLAACVLQDSSELGSAISAARATCRQWRHAVDTNLTHLRPSRWPRGSLASFRNLRLLDLSGLFLDQQDDVERTLGIDPHLASSSRTAAIEDSSPAAGAGSSSHSHSHDLLMGAAVLHSRMWDSNNSPSSSASSSSSSGGSQDCVVRVRASNSAALTSYVASRWPEAVPHVTPAACLSLWRELPSLPGLQALAINGSILLVQSVRTRVDHCADDAAGLSTLQHFAGDDCAAVSSITITHTYVLQLPPALCQLTGLQALSVAWQLLTADCCSDGSGSSSSSSNSNHDLHNGSLVLRGRRRSYEGRPCPNVVHVADPLVQLPSQLSRLSNLQQLCLAGSISGPDALAPLSALLQLRRLALGPGELDMSALLQLRSTVVPQLRQLVLSQQGPWDARAVAAVLAAAQQLQELEVDEREISGPSHGWAIPPEQRLTVADVEPLAATLHTLAWTTCAQRLSTGCSLLGRNPAAGAATQHDSAQEPGGWLGGLTALRQLCISGWPSGTAVLSAPVLELLSPSIGSCVHLEQLLIHGLGVPLLPPVLAQMPALHTVSVASTTMVRRALLPAERALEVLGSCTGLRSLTLAGCELRQLPKWLLGLQHLTQLQLQGNYLQDLPANLGTMGLPMGLQVLDLNDNRLRDVPAGIAALSRLVQLHLDANYLSSLPAQVWQLPELQLLSVRENMLPALPELRSSCCRNKDSGDGSKNRQLQHLTTAAESAVQLLLSEEDEEMVAGTGVLHLSCQDSATSMSSCGRAMVAAAGAAAGGAGSCCYSSKLKELVLADNQLCQLPNSVSLLTALEVLNLDNNQLRVLPDTGSLWCLTRLTTLLLGHNHLKKLPAGLSKLERLVELDISGNHLPPSSCSVAAAAAADESSAAAAPARPRSSSSITPPAMSTGVSVAAAAASSAAAVMASAGASSGSVQLGSRRVSGTKRHKGCRSIASIRQQLPAPLRNMLQLQQLRVGGQHTEARAGHQCPLQLLLGGLSELIEKLRSLAPAHHQCPVTRAAAAAVAHITAATSGKRAKRERRKQLLECVHTQPGWVVVPTKAVAGAVGAATTNVVAAGKLGWGNGNAVGAV